MGLSYGQGVFKLTYELAPISLVGGDAGGLPGGVLSIISLIGDAFGGLLGDGGGFGGLDEFTGNFYPIAGSTLIDQQVAQYPFANQAIAANATIAQARKVSLAMRFPVRPPGLTRFGTGMAAKQFVMTALVTTLQSHIQAGGMFNVATPAYTYANCLLTGLTDISGGETLQAQVTWRWDFLKPLLTLDDAAIAENAMMSLLSGGGATDGALSGTLPAIGNPITFASPSLIPANSGVGIAGIAAGFGGF